MDNLATPFIIGELWFIALRINFNITNNGKLSDNNAITSPCVSGASPTAF